jgi:putative transposase
VRALQGRGISLTRACRLIGVNRSNFYYAHKPKDDTALKTRMHELAQERPRWGWRRLFIILRRREGYDVGETRFRRLYCELQLQVRPRKKRKVNYVRGAIVPPVSAVNERWSIDFMHDRLTSGRGFRSLNIGDDFSRECLALEISHSFGSADVIRVFEALAFERGLPQSIRFDNELSAHVKDAETKARFNVLQDER